MTRRHLQSLVCVAAALLASAALSAAPLELVGPASTLGCEVVRGETVAFLAPDRGIVLLGTRPFPGSTSVGTIDGDRLSGSLAGYGELDLQLAAGPPGAEVFGLLDRTLPLEGRRGCFGFGTRRFSDIDDLKTYLHWWVRRVLAPLALASDEPAPTVWLEGRMVTLEVAVSGHRAVSLRIREGSTVGFRPTGEASTLFFQPFVVGRAGRRAAVRISVKQGDYFGPGVTHDAAFVAVGPERPVPVPSDPPLEIRLEALETAVSFVD
ncbi:MAG: hypothetical protein R3244_12275 [Thermoanaerobaculia bacterium]|nr:hypothetical protein [Thermoanaerobaculia bacterium]